MAKKSKRKKPKPRPKRPRGRPSKFSQELADEICLIVSTSSIGIRRLCAQHPEFPDPVTIYRWMLKNEEFRKQYARAKEFQCQLLFDEIVEIADTAKPGVVVKTDAVGKKETIYRDMTDHRRLQIDARKWSLSKLLPKKYGDRLEVAGASDPLEELLSEFRRQYNDTLTDSGHDSAPAS